MYRYPLPRPLAAALLLLPLVACAQAPVAPQQTKVTEIFRGHETALGQPLRFPQKDGTLVVSIYEIPAGSRLPVHRHPQQRVAYVMAGQLRVVTPEGKGWDYKPGDVVVEVLDHWHSGEALGSEAVRLLVIDQTEGDSANLELHP
ncbi:cupin domain-containing protein [Roseomonas marmotae]|uniref:Cupin domain-containing protein n=1 Tax=Roseomonas marmotae TaxID=2768161 RepID=A0ABS3KE23_9PROT|nr:cupin domain-containing protein [Roseomonas marmotae]MBO1075713.1 cupin domain-containing protein [Roseomonas marmotae]QTI80444.1 cupin domain-containing protein [Roseomonas marmotae]